MGPFEESTSVWPSLFCWLPADSTSLPSPQVSNGSSLGFHLKSSSSFPPLCLPTNEQGLLEAPGPWRDQQGGPAPHNAQGSTPSCLRANSHLPCFCDPLIPRLSLPSSPGNFCPPGGWILLVVLPYHTCRFKLGPLPQHTHTQRHTHTHTHTLSTPFIYKQHSLQCAKASKSQLGIFCNWMVVIVAQ